MNRRPAAGDTRGPATLRSRGLLCLDAAARAGSVSFLDAALGLVKRDPYAPCTLIGVGVDGEAWALEAGPGEPRVTALARGWHVITHRDVDDPTEPRTKWILEDIREERPATAAKALDLMAGYLRSHGEEGHPLVCLHRDRFPTVSSSLLALGVSGGPRYLHAAGPPCVTEYRDHSSLFRTGDQ
jgi:hypothetical protein